MYSFILSIVGADFVVRIFSLNQVNNILTNSSYFTSNAMLLSLCYSQLLDNANYFSFFPLHFHTCFAKSKNL